MESLIPERKYGNKSLKENKQGEPAPWCYKKAYFKRKKDLNENQ
jgi:hypothetical protein